jgi:hypothetical protein
MSGERAMGLDIPPDERERLLAAYELGRLLSRFRFHGAQMALLLGDNVSQVEDVLAEITKGSRRLRPPGGRQEIQAWVTERVQEVTEEYRDAEALSDLRHDLAEDVEQAPGETDALAKVEWYARTVGILSQRLRDRFVEAFPGGGVALELGEVVDEGLRPPKVWGHCLKVIRPGPSFSDPDAPPAQFALVPVVPGGVAPDQGWEEQVALVAGELGIADRLPGEVFRRPLPSVEEAVDFGDVVERLDAAIRQALGPEVLTGVTTPELPVPSPTAGPAGQGDSGPEAEASGQDHPGAETGDREEPCEGPPVGEGRPETVDAPGVAVGQPPAGYLGVRFDPVTNTVHRGGDSVCLARSLNDCKLMGFFLDRGQVPSHYQKIHKLWDDHELVNWTDSEASDTAKNMIRQAISHLNGNLKPLGVRISGKMLTGGYYVLVALPTPNKGPTPGAGPDAPV